MELIGEVLKSSAEIKYFMLLLLSASVSAAQRLTGSGYMVLREIKKSTCAEVDLDQFMAHDF